MNIQRYKRLISISVVLSAVLLGGCNSLNTMVSDETKYGQIYMLEEVLSDASAACNSEQRMFDAKQWAMQVSVSLKEHSRYLNKESASYIEAGKLLRQLPVVAGYYGKPSCEAVELAAVQTRTLIHTLTAAPVVVASR